MLTGNLFDKVDSFRRLLDSGLRVPRTLTIIGDLRAGDTPDFPEMPLRGEEWWYVRFDSWAGEAHLRLHRICKTREIQQSVKKLFRRSLSGQFSFVIQKAVESVWSGCLLVRESFYEIEAVGGALSTLVKQGTYAIRRAYDDRARLLVSEKGPQKYSYRLTHGKITKRRVNGPPQTKTLLGVLNQVRRRVEPSTLLEWMVSPKGEVYFTDMKAVPQEYLTSPPMSQEVNGIYRNKSVTFAEILALSQSKSARVKVFKMPTYSCVSKLRNLDAVIFEDGAFLAHAPVYAALAGITTIFCPSRQLHNLGGLT